MKQRADREQSGPFPGRGIRRRDVIGSALALGLAGRSAWAQAPMRSHMPSGTTPALKGPLVYLDYDQVELDTAYDQDPWAPNVAAIRARVAQKNAAARARLGAPRRLRYGSGPSEALDWYPARASGAPLHVFIHGGAWRAGSAADYAYHAEKFVDANAHFIALDFDNVLETGGDLGVMARQVRDAVAWVHENAADQGGDRARLFVSGHSSGAHLAGVVLTTDWPREYGLPADVIRGGLLASGMFDLYPVSLSARREYVRFTPQLIAALSPQRHLERLGAPVIVAHGTAETPEFQRQSRDFASAASAAGKDVRTLVAQGYNHFEMVEDLGNPYGPIGRAALEQMNLLPAPSSQSMAKQ